MKFKKILSVVLCICFLIVPIDLQVSAVTNPYGQWQTFNGITTIRCTYYAWQQAYDNTGVALPNLGNAINWYTGAKNAGYSTGTTAKAKSIAVWSTTSGYGHVGYVVSVSGSTMTVNEAGLTNSAGTAALNGNGVKNGGVYNNVVGQAKYSGSSTKLVGFIYLTEDKSSVSVTSYPDKNTITDRNAILWGKVNKPSNYEVTKIGIRVRKDNSSYSKGWSKYEAPSKNYVGESVMYPYYNINSELGVTLSPGLKYWVQFYAVVNGKEYWSVEYYFNTTGKHTHTYPSEWSTVISVACTTNGSAKKVCTVCESIKTKTLNAKGHSFINDCDTTCNECGYTRDITHTYSNACDSSCNVCGDIRSITHSYSVATCTKAKICTVCGATSGSALSHKYSNACDKNCNVCGDIRKITHSDKTTTTKATIENDGEIVKKCTVCGDIESTKTIKMIKSVKLSKTTYTYNGKSKKPSVTVKDSSGKKLTEGKDYTVTYPSGRKKVGIYKVKVKFKGNYKGTETLTFKINPKATTVSKVTAAKKSLKVKLKKQSSQTTGYQIQYSTSKKFTSSTTKTKTVKSYKTTSVTLKSLKANKKYYVRVRTYKTVDGKKYYSSWSDYKSRKTKK